MKQQQNHISSFADPGFWKLGIQQWAMILFNFFFLGLNAQGDCNLLVNPVGNDPVTTGWNILQVSGNSPGFGQQVGTGFISTYGGCGTLRWNRKSQTINLVAKGYDPSWLDSSPDLFVSEMFSTGVTNGFCTYPSGNTLDLYYLKVELRDASNNVIASINWGSTGSPLFAPTGGITHSHTFTGYPSGVRYVYFEDGGMDAGWWNGFYGTYMDQATVEFVNGPDNDGDGVENGCDGCPDDANKTSPGICGCGVADTDSDGDGTADCNDGCPSDPNKIAPGQCGCGVADTDSDGDGTANCNDGCPNDANKTAPGICGCGVADTDTDSDGTADCNDGCPNDANKIAPGQCGCGVADTDTDGDGTADCNDGCPDDPNKTAPGICGCGVADTDSDGDGTANCNDGCPNDANKTAPGICGCGVADTDSDGDGTADCNDGCPNDANKTAPGQCGCGTADTDSDCDGIADCNDICPGGDDSVDSNGDNIPDCSQLLNYANYSSAWKCAPNKIQVCHNGNNPQTICISKNALAAHYNHGDKVGPCTSCGNSLRTVTYDTDEEDGHDHDGEDTPVQTMKIVPNPTSDHAEIWLEGLNEPGMITLLDLNGKTIWQTRFAAGQNVIRLDFVGSMSSGGTFFVRLDSSERSFTRRLTVFK